MVWPKGILRDFKCTLCEKPYRRIAVNSLYCDGCRKIMDSTVPKKTTKKCKECGRKFHPRTAKSRFCSALCRSRNYNRVHDIAGRMRKMREQRKEELKKRVQKKLETAKL